MNQDQKSPGPGVPGQTRGPHLEQQVDGAPVGGHGHSTAFWDGLVGRQRNHGLRVGQGLDLQTVGLDLSGRGRVDALEVTWGETESRSGSTAVSDPQNTQRDEVNTRSFVFVSAGSHKL